jgi:hypothetical protein
MPTRYNKGSRDSSRNAGAVLDRPETNHKAVEHQGHNGKADGHSPAATVGHGIPAFGHNDIELLAYEFWQARGCPFGSAEEDWVRAVEQLRSRAYGH